jgi:hypothetical protein
MQELKKTKISKKLWTRKTKRKKMKTNSERMTIYQVMSKKARESRNKNSKNTHREASVF